MREFQKADGGFVSGLEWQLKTEIRRNQRFGPGLKRPLLPGVARTAVLILLCAATGYAAAMTVERFENARQKELLKVRAETNLELLQAREEVVREIVSDVSRQANSGLVNRTQLAEVELQSELIGLEIDRARLDLEEVELSGRTPDNELYAPMVGRRDFVSERLQIDQFAALARTRFIEAEMEGIRELVQEGLVDEAQAREMELQLARSETETEDVVRRLELRHSFLTGDVTARQVTLQEKLSLARDRLGDAEKTAVLVEEHHVKMLAMQADGLVSVIQMKEVELGLAESRAEVKLARAELEYLEEAVRQ